MLKLVGTDEEKFYSWALKPGSYKIGRKSDCDFCIPHRTVSRHHAVLSVPDNGNSMVLEDLGSHNGTFVDSKRISKKTGVKAGMSIMFGSTEFKIVKSDKSDAGSAALPKTILGDEDLQKSVFLSIDEALKPLPEKASELPNLLPTFFDMAKMLVLTEPQEVMLNKSLEMISKVIPAERLAVLFVSDDNEEVYTAAARRSGNSGSEGFHLSKTIVGDIISNKRAIVLGNPEEDPRFATQKSIIMSDMKSVVAVPMFDEGRILGILYADTSNPAHSYNDEHMRVMATFGNIIASRLLNYELLDERQEKEVMEAELRRASSIQKNLLVTEPLEIKDYQIFGYQEQSRQVGGDLYDYKLLPDGKLLFLLADVSGKGMGAALLMSNILASFRILYEMDNFDLLRAVESASLQLCRFSSPGDFATLFTGLLDPETNQLQFINAGHNPPLLVREGNVLEELQPSGTMIGAFDFSTWEKQTVEMNPGDLVYIYTDGITEADNTREQLGEERMQEILRENSGRSPSDLADAFMDRINEFMGDEPRSDDITMMILKRNKK